MQGLTPLGARASLIGLNAQLAASDAVRKAQGDAMEALGFGPFEHPHDIVATGPGWRLRAYGGSGGGRPLLIVPAPIKRPYVWDLTRAVSVVGRLLHEARRVRLLEWTPPASGAQRPDLDAHIDAIGASVALIAQEPGGGAPILIGHSFGGTLSAVFAASAPQGASGLVLLSAPICFGERVCTFRDALVALAPAAPSGREPVPGSMLTLASMLAAPRTFVWSQLADLFASLADPRRLDVHLRVTRWALDEAPVPARLTRQILEWLYCEDRFYRGELSVNGRIVGPGDLSTPTLAVVVAADEIAPSTTVGPFLDAAPAPSRLIEYPGETGVGLEHLALLVGREAHRLVWPEIIAWIKAQD